MVKSVWEMPYSRPLSLRVTIPIKDHKVSYMKKKKILSVKLSLVQTHLATEPIFHLMLTRSGIPETHNRPNIIQMFIINLFSVIGR